MFQTRGEPTITDQTMIFFSLSFKSINVQRAMPPGGEGGAAGLGGKSHRGEREDELAC